MTGLGQFDYVLHSVVSSFGLSWTIAKPVCFIDIFEGYVKQYVTAYYSSSYPPDFLGFCFTDNVTHPIKCNTWAIKYKDMHLKTAHTESKATPVSELDTGNLFHINTNLYGIGLLHQGNTLVYQCTNAVSKKKVTYSQMGPGEGQELNAGEVSSIEPISPNNRSFCYTLFSFAGSLRANLPDFGPFNLDRNLLHPGLSNSVFATWRLAPYACPQAISNPDGVHLFWLLSPSFKGYLLWLLRKGSDKKLNFKSATVYKQVPGQIFAIKGSMPCFSVICVPDSGFGLASNVADLLLYRCVTAAEVLGNATKIDPTILFAVQPFSVKTPLEPREIANFNKICTSAQYVIQEMKRKEADRTDPARCVRCDKRMGLISLACKKEACAYRGQSNCLSCAFDCVSAKHDLAVLAMSKIFTAKRLILYVVNGLKGLMDRWNTSCAVLQDILHEAEYVLPEAERKTHLQNFTSILNPPYSVAAGKEKRQAENEPDDEPPTKKSKVNPNNNIESGDEDSE